METLIGVTLSITVIGFMIVLISQARLRIEIRELADHQKVLGELMTNNIKHHMLKETYFDEQARDIQGFIEKFLGRGFNVQCVFTKDKNFTLWIWKVYETRDMGAQLEYFTVSSLITEFLRIYYTQKYFVDAVAFPDKD